MAVRCMAICFLLISLAAIPLNFALAVRISDRVGFGAGLAPFFPRMALRRALQRACGARRHLPWKMAEAELDRAAARAAAWRAGRYLIRHAHFRSLRALGRVGGADAAQTALICGCAHAIEGMLSPFISLCEVRLKADFSAAESDVQICGMVSVRLGHIIFAALIGAWNYGIRRIAHGKASD